MQKIEEGWGWPGASKKAHYFAEGDTRSICMRWMYGGPREQGNDDSRDNCAECRKRLKKRRQQCGVKP